MSSPMRRPSSILPALALIAATSAHAQPPAERSPWTFAVGMSVAAFDDANLDGGGNVGLDFASVSLSAGYSVSPQTSVGLGVQVAENEFSFSGNGAVASLAPWSDVTLTTVSLPMRFGIDRQWSVSVIPSYQRAGDDGAISSDSGRYGAVFAVSYAVSARQYVGLGFSYFTGLDDDTVLPIVLVDWQFDDHWRLTNPLTAGPTGPAGLELVRSFDNGWEAGIGGAYRSLRFRLASDNASAPGGTGTYSGTIGFLRAQYRFNPQLSMALFAGLRFNGELEVHAKGGRTLYSEGVGTVPMIGISLSGRF